MDSWLLVLLVIAGMSWTWQNTLLVFRIPETHTEIMKFFKEISKEQGEIAIQLRICGRNMKNSEGDVQREDMILNSQAAVDYNDNLTVLSDSVPAGFCYEVRDSIARYKGYMGGVQRSLLLVPKNGRVDEDTVVQNSEFGPGPNIVTTFLHMPKKESNNDIGFAYNRTDKWPMCQTQFTDSTTDILMIENLLVWRPSSWSVQDRSDVLHIGISGGQTNNYINAFFPNINQVTIESDEILSDIVAKWFTASFSKTKSKLVVETVDEIQYLKQSVAKGFQFDSIFIHQCDSFNGILRCPSSKYLELETIKLMRQLLADDGVIMYRSRVLSKIEDKEERNKTINQIRNAFSYCIVEDGMGMLQTLILCSPSEIPSTRNEILMKNRMKLIKLMQENQC